MNSLCGTVMAAFFPLIVIDMLPEMTLYESIVDRRQWETSYHNHRLEAEDLKSVCSSAEG